MKTVKLKIRNSVNFDNELRLFNSIIRYSYNCFKDGLNEKDVRAKVNQLFSGNSWFLQSALKEGQSVFDKNKGKKVIFGGKFNLKQYLKGLISKDEYKENKLSPITIQGEAGQKGNRLFDFDFTDNKITYKPSRLSHMVIELSELRKNLKKEFNQLQNLTDDKKTAVTVKFNNEFVFFTYDETVLKNEMFKSLKSNRVMGIDLNPNYIGLSVIEFDKYDKFKVIHKQVFDLSKLNLSTGQASDSKKSVYRTNKSKFELIEICHTISDLMNYWKCKKLVIEELSIKSSDKKKGKTFNRLCNNVWNRNLIINKLKMLSNIHNFELVEVNPAYSSVVGNLLYGNENTPDMIASSIEVARRGYKKFSKGWFYPVFSIERLNERWKQTLDGIGNWKLAFKEIKKSDLKYRFQLLDYFQNAVFSQFYKKSKISLYEFL